MGMWLLQNIRRDLGKTLSYDDMMHMAEKSKKYRYLDLNSSLFTAPDDMIEVVKTYFNDSNMELDEILSSVYHSLAKSYKAAVVEIEKITGHKINAVHIVGGGSKDNYLNKLTAEYTERKVTAGPVEGTAIGNIISQLISDGIFSGLSSARELVGKSFDIEEVKLK